MIISPGAFFHCFEIYIFQALRDGGGEGGGAVKGQKIAQNEKNNYICHAPYLRNSIAYDHEFSYTCVK